MCSSSTLCSMLGELCLVPTDKVTHRAPPRRGTSGTGYSTALEAARTALPWTPGAWEERIVFVQREVPRQVEEHLCRLACRGRTRNSKGDEKRGSMLCVLMSRLCRSMSNPHAADKQKL